LRRTSRLTGCRIPPELAGDLTHAALLGQSDRDLLAFGQRQVAAERLGQVHGRHPATFAKPALPDIARHTGALGRGDRGQPIPNAPPEPPPQLLQLNIARHHPPPVSGGVATTS
jgi:hypothetical protein